MSRGAVAGSYVICTQTGHGDLCIYGHHGCRRSTITCELIHDTAGRNIVNNISASQNIQTQQCEGSIDDVTVSNVRARSCL